MAIYSYRPAGRSQPERKRIYYTLAVLAVIVGVFLVFRFRSKKIDDSLQAEVDNSSTNIVQPAAPSENQDGSTEKVRFEMDLNGKTPEVKPDAQSTAETSNFSSNVPPSAPATGDVNIGGFSNTAAAGIITEAYKDLSAGKIIAARDKLNDALRMPQMSSSQRDLLEKELSVLSDKWLFGKDVQPDDALCSLYTVGSGETLVKIAQRHKVPYEIIMMINDIKRAESLQAGQSIKIIEGPFNAILYRSTFTMDVFLQNTYVKSYKVGLGREKNETPTGIWRVKIGGKLISPPWTDPDTGRRYEAEDPDYPLGSRWIGLEGVEGNAKGRTGFAIHGTKDPETIGTRSSRGCIRLFNGDVVTVYNMMAEGLSEVRIQD